MAMEVTQVLQGSNQSGRADTTSTQFSNAQREAIVAAQQKQQQNQEQLTREQIDRFTAELRQVSQAFNKRLSFNYNEELQLMVVKVIDGNTDKVIKELPPRELQRVHMRIREAIGLLLDESA